MKKSLRLFLLLPSFVVGGLFTNTAKAQCGTRYHDKIFADSLVSDILYGYNIKSTGTVDSLKLDIYFPKGDVLTARPLVIMAHGGNFLGGSKTGSDVKPLCQDLARLGYVAVSINYRVGMTGFPLPGPDSSDATEAVMRAVQDGRAAVRFMRKSFETGGNPYRIDTSMIFFGGVSAGGFIGLQMAYLDQMSEFPTYIDTIGKPGLTGGLEGNTGTPGYSSRIHGVINICGALGDTAWIHAGDEPLLSLHGNVDNTVPYGSSTIVLLGTFPLLEVDGSYSIAARANEVGILNCFETWEGQDHVPEVSNAFYYDSTIVLMRNFLAHFVCGDALNCSYGPSIVNYIGMNEYVLNENIHVYPNPASTQFTVEFGEVSESVNVSLIDATGKTVFSTITNQNRVTVSRNDYPAGIYLVRIQVGDAISTSKLIFE